MPLWVSKKTISTKAANSWSNKPNRDETKFIRVIRVIRGCLSSYVFFNFFLTAKNQTHPYTRK